MDLGTDGKFRKERNVDGLGVNMIFGLGLGDFMNMRSLAYIYSVVWISSMYGGLPSI